MRKPDSREMFKTGKKRRLTRDELRLLCRSVIDSWANIYSVCSHLFGYEADDETFEELLEQCKIAKCGECGLWCYTELKDPAQMLCPECYTEIND